MRAAFIRLRAAFAMLCAAFIPLRAAFASLCASFILLCAAFIPLRAAFTLLYAPLGLLRAVAGGSRVRKLTGDVKLCGLRGPGNRAHRTDMA